MRDVLEIPQDLSIDVVPTIVYKLQELALVFNSICVDFSHMESFDDFAGLYLAIAIHDLPCTVEVEGLNSRFAEFIGLKKALLERRLPNVTSLPELRIEDKRYLRMCAYQLDSSVFPRSHGKPDSEKVFDLASKIAEKLVPKHVDESARWAFRQAIKEVLLNIVHHSNADRFFFCAQYSPADYADKNVRNTAEFVVIDRGDGLQRTLSRNAKYTKIQVASAALKLCIKKGVSRFEGAEGLENPYENRGYGLYLLSEFGKRGRGRAIVATGDSALLMSAHREKWFANAFSGTAIGIRLDLDHVEDFRDLAKGLTRREIHEKTVALATLFDDMEDNRQDPRHGAGQQRE